MPCAATSFTEIQVGSRKAMLNKAPAAAMLVIIRKMLANADESPCRPADSHRAYGSLPGRQEIPSARLEVIREWLPPNASELEPIAYKLNLVVYLAQTKCIQETF